MGDPPGGRSKTHTSNQHRGALRGTPGSACPQPAPNATELPSCAPISASRELRKDGGGGGGGVARRARAARAPKAKSCATSCGTSSATPCATSCAASFTSSPFGFLTPPSVGGLDRLFFSVFRFVISKGCSVVSPPVQMNTDISATARSLVFSLELWTKPTPPPIYWMPGHTQSAGPPCPGD